MLASCGRSRCLNPGWTELWTNPWVDLLSCLISAFVFLQIPLPGKGPFAVVVRDKPGHCVAFVSIQLEPCKIRALMSRSHNSAVVRVSRWPLNQGGPWGSAALKTEISCIAGWSWLSVLLSCSWASAFLGVSESPWAFRKERCNSSAQSTLGCALLDAFPAELSCLDPLMEHPPILYNQELLSGSSPCSLAVVALCLLVLKCPHNGPGPLWEKFPVFLPTLNRTVSFHRISSSSENAFHWEAACTKVPWHSLSCSFVWSF